MGYFAKIASCDLFLVLDDVALSGVDGENWVNRVWVSGPAGDVLLTVPLHRHAGNAIRTIEVDGERWVEKHIRTLTQSYARALYRYQLVFRDIVFPCDTAAGVWGTAARLCELLGVHKRVKLQSVHPVRGAGEDMLLEYCRMFRADRFLFGSGGRAYVTPEKWAAAGIEPVFQSFAVPEYRPGLTRILSTVDAIAHVGVRKTREMIHG
jgi:hypothetical protein